MKYNEKTCRKLTSEEQKQALINLLDRAVKYFDDHNIKYVLASGTALGAVRHKGFIPWDDDIDLGIPRDDYERLITLLRNDSSQLKYFEIRDTKGFYYPFMKIYDENIFLKEKNAKREINLSLDIFPLDYVSDNIEEELVVQDKALKLKKLTAFKNNKIFYTPTKWKNSKKRVLLPVFYAVNIMMQLMSKRMYLAKYKKLLNPLRTKTGKMRNLIWSSTTEKGIDIDFFYNPVEVEFEGKKYKMARDTNIYLKALYGPNYMTPPEENKRIPHPSFSYTKKI